MFRECEVCLTLSLTDCETCERLINNEVELESHMLRFVCDGFELSVLGKELMSAQVTTRESD